MKKKSTSQSAFFNLRILIAAVFCLASVAIALFGMGAFSNVFAQANTAKTNQDPPGTQTPDVVRMVGPVSLDQDLRNLPYIAPKPESEEERGPLSRYPHVGMDREQAPRQDPTLAWRTLKTSQRRFAPEPTMPAPLLTFEGQSGDPENRVPDSDGDVGPNHYVQSINRSIMIFDKNGISVSGPTTYDSFFAGLAGTPCGAGADQNNQGDPFTLYDPIADRWLISDFAFDFFPGGSSFWECIAVSKTAILLAAGGHPVRHCGLILLTQVTSVTTQSSRCGTLEEAQPRMLIS